MSSNKVNITPICQDGNHSFCSGKLTVKRYQGFRVPSSTVLKELAETEKGENFNRNFAKEKIPCECECHHYAK